MQHRQPLSFEPSASIIDWTTFDRINAAKGRLVSAQGLVAEIGEVGAALVSLRLPGEDGAAGSGDQLVWSLDHPLHYLFAKGAISGVIGPVANRLSGARATVNGKALKLQANEGDNLLHSGAASTLYRFWHLQAEGKNSIIASLTLPHMADGFPGARALQARYSFNEAGDTLVLELSMTTNRDTLVNMTHHPYWNLTGGREGLEAHRLQVLASGALTLDDAQIPTGEVTTPTKARMNFSRPKTLDLKKGRYDGFLVLSEPREFDAAVNVPSMSRRLVVSSNQAGVQVFTHPGGTLPAPQLISPDSPATARNQPDVGPVEGLPEAFCLEPQIHPDAPNQPDFPAILLPAGGRYQSRIRYQLSW